MIIKLTKDMIYSGNLILVNQRFPYHEKSDLLKLRQLKGQRFPVQLKKQFAVVYEKVIEELAAKSAIVAVSGWRSEKEQKQLFDSALKSHGRKFTEQFVAQPGHSEHHSGLALDVSLNQPDIDFLCPYFPSCGIAESFRKTALKYGVVQRYATDKAAITEIANEEWHFRYVGTPHSLLMKKFGDCLEEYHQRLQTYFYGVESIEWATSKIKAEVAFLPAAGAVTEFAISDKAIFQVSGNNDNGFIITVWKSNHDNNGI